MKQMNIVEILEWAKVEKNIHKRVAREITNSVTARQNARMNGEIQQVQREIKDKDIPISKGGRSKTEL